MILKNKFFNKFEMPNLAQFAQLLMLSVYIIIAWFYLGLLRPTNFYYVIIYSFVLDAVLNLMPKRRTATGKIKFPVTGFVVGCALALLLESQNIWLYILASSVAIGSKTLIQTDGKHVFNPANIGIISALVLSGGKCTVNIAQWSGASWVLSIMFIMGFIVAFMAKRINVSLSYLISFFFFSSIYSYFTHLPLLFLPGSLLGISTILFAFHMITDPATTPSDPKKQLLVGLFVAFFNILLYANNILYAQLLASLIVVSLNNFIQGFRRDIQIA
ncbi:MAG: hypothetical protein WC635_06925 [Bacteriovorax sp.]